jgi:pyruvate/2-oxoglutarate dehydrogenase complex dihydrolipoamide acyltransferase (E2) component
VLYQLQVPGPIPDVNEVRVLEWHGAPGYAFAVGDLMVEVETHKAIVEIRAERPGVLRAILCAEGEWLGLGAPLAVLSDSPEEPLPAGPEGLALLAVRFEVT